MRSSRFIAILVALMFAAVAPLSSAQAATEGTSARAKTSHVIKNYGAGEIRNSGRFFVRAQVPTFPNRYVKLQKRTCKTCAFKPFKQRKTSGTGHFRIEFDGPRGTCYRLMVPGTWKYRITYRGVGCIVRA